MSHTSYSEAVVDVQEKFVARDVLVKKINFITSSDHSRVRCELEQTKRHRVDQENIFLIVSTRDATRRDATRVEKKIVDSDATRRVSINFFCDASRRERRTRDRVERKNNS
jgi:hypothetical protein